MLDKTQFTWLWTRQQLDKINIPSINLGHLQCSFNHMSIVSPSFLIRIRCRWKNMWIKLFRSAFYYLHQSPSNSENVDDEGLQSVGPCNLFLAGWIIAIVSAIRYWRNTVESTAVCSSCRRPSRASQTQVWLDLCRYTRQTSLASHVEFGFPWSKESSSRFACSFSSAEPMRLQPTSPRCCIRSNARRDTTSVLMRDSTMTFLDIPPFAPDLVVLLFPVRHSGTVYRTL